MLDVVQIGRYALFDIKELSMRKLSIEVLAFTTLLVMAAAVLALGLHLVTTTWGLAGLAALVVGEYTRRRARRDVFWGIGRGMGLAAGAWLALHAAFTPWGQRDITFVALTVIGFLFAIDRLEEFKTEDALARLSRDRRANLALRRIHTA